MMRGACGMRRAMGSERRAMRAAGATHSWLMAGRAAADQFI